MDEVSKLICGYCRNPFTGRMEADFNYSMGSEDTGIYDENTTVEIYCDHCGKLVYKKNSAD